MAIERAAWENYLNFEMAFTIPVMHNELLIYALANLAAVSFTSSMFPAM